MRVRVYAYVKFCYVYIVYKYTFDYIQRSMIILKKKQVETFDFQKKRIRMRNECVLMATGLHYVVLSWNTQLKNLHRNKKNKGL